MRGRKSSRPDISVIAFWGGSEGDIVCCGGIIYEESAGMYFYEIPPCAVRWPHVLNFLGGFSVLYVCTVHVQV